MHYLLFIHIIAGTVSLLAAVLAVVSAKGKKVHIWAGRTYFWGMFLIFITAIPMSIISSNIFLFLIAIFSFYLAFAGMRFARNRKGVATILDWIAICLMIFSGIPNISCFWFSDFYLLLWVMLILGVIKIILQQEKREFRDT